MSEQKKRELLVDGTSLTLRDMDFASQAAFHYRLADDAVTAMEASLQVVHDVVEKGDPVYGVNTGFGKFSEVRISREELGQLQVNLVRSHACGVGSPLPEAIVRMVLVMKANALAKGRSGCRPVLAQRLLDMANADLLPVVPAHGSVGASGDLAPLAHIALVLIGEGEALYRGERMAGGLAMEQAGIEPVELGPKEGLSVLNGTQVSAALAIASWLRLEQMVLAADIAAAWTLEGVAGLTNAFDERIHSSRGHAGAVLTAKRVRGAVAGSGILVSEASRRRVQDPYSIRCAPQVHGAVRDVLTGTGPVLQTEMNGVTDNPVVFAETGEVISGGNFHAEPVALVADQLAIAGAELASISERRSYLLTDPDSSGLPAFLVKQGGLNSGFMLHHVTQAALVSANKTLAHPASIDSIPTSAGKEDHVSMATWGGFKALEVMERLTTVLAIECMAAAQAVDMRSPDQPGELIGSLQQSLRMRVETLDRDRVSYTDIDEARLWMLENNWLEIGS